MGHSRARARAPSSLEEVLRGGGGASGGPKADVTLTMSDDVFVKLASGKLQPQMAFIQGKLKISGNIALSMKLTPVLKAAQPGAKL